MNILIDILPKEVRIGKKMYKINSDFRTSILFELLMYDGSISDDLKFKQALELYYPYIPPEQYFEEAIYKNGEFPIAFNKHYLPLQYASIKFNPLK